MINESITSPVSLVTKGVVAAAGLIGYVTYYKSVQDENYSMRVWEDMYGRNLFFFFPSIAYFLYCGKHNENISFFELEESVRWYFSFRLATTLGAYGFLALAITEGDGIFLPILILFFS